MPSLKYALTKGGPKRLEISWHAFSQKRTVKLDGKELGVIPDARTLQTGWEFTAKNGTKLTIRKGSVWGAPFDIRLNDKPLPNTDGDPGRRVNMALGVIGYIAFVNILVGLNAMTGGTNTAGITRQDGPFVLFTGLIYGVLGFFVWRGSRVALGLTIVGYIVDTLGIFFADPGALLHVGLSALFIRPIFLWLMIRAIQPIRELRTQKQLEAKTRPPMTRTELSLLLAAVLLVIGIGVVLYSRFIANGKLSQVIADADATEQAFAHPPTRTPYPTRVPPTDTPTRLPTSTPTPTATPQPTQTPIPETAVALSLPYIDFLKYDSLLDRAIIVTKSSPALHIYDLETGQDLAIALEDWPTALALSPDEQFAAIGHAQKISYVDLIKHEVITTIDVNINVSGMAVLGNGWIYAYDQQSRKRQAVEIATHWVSGEDKEASRYPTATVYSPDHKILYMPDGSIFYQYHIPQNDVPLGPTGHSFLHIGTNHIETLSLSWDGRYIYTDQGVIMKIRERDLVEWAYFSRHTTEDYTAGIPVQTFGPNWIGELAQNGAVNLYHVKNWDAQESIMPTISILPPQVAGVEAQANHLEYRWLLVNTAGTRYYMIFQNMGLDNPVVAANQYGLIVRDVPE